MPDAKLPPKWIAFFKAIIPVLIIIFLIVLLSFWSSAPRISDMRVMQIVILVILALIPMLLYGLYKSNFSNQTKGKNSMYRFFFIGLRIAILILLLIGIIGIWAILENATNLEGAIYKAIALGIVIIWSCIFLGYFLWAVYFYNINYGLTEEDWEKINHAKERKRSGDFYSQSDLEEEPTYNPYKDETFGLPPGTVRGMIAFTLLFGALAMLIASLGMKNELDPSSMFWDQYEFFKTAFLMMIAFYFGSRSLQYLQNRNQPFRPVQQSKENPGAMSAPAPAVTGPTSIPDVSNVQVESKPATTEQTVSSTVLDPMKAK